MQPPAIVVDGNSWRRGQFHLLQQCSFFQRLLTFRHQ